MKSTLDRECKVYRRKDTMHIELEGALTIHKASLLKDAFVTAFDNSDRIKLKLEKCDSIDTTFLQLMCSAHKTAVLSGKDFALEGSIPDFIGDFLNDMGFMRERCTLFGDTAACLWAVRGARKKGDRFDRP